MLRTSETSWSTDVRLSCIGTCTSADEIMELIVNGVFLFDPELVTCLSPDYSNAGMGWILQQKTCKCADINPIY